MTGLGAAVLTGILSGQSGGGVGTINTAPAPPQQNNSSQVTTLVMVFMIVALLIAGGYLLTRK